MKRTTLEEFIKYASEIYPGLSCLTRAEIKNVQKTANCSIPVSVYNHPISTKRPFRFDLCKSLKDGNAIESDDDNIDFEVNEACTDIQDNIDNIPDDNIRPVGNDEYSAYVPDIDDKFVPYGVNYNLINAIVSARDFLPMYIYGISGVGKTMQIEQACAQNKRPFFRVQITKDTTNEDLIGSYTLINGTTVWSDGPILKAYRSGGVLLLDEIDLNSSLMILQVVLENKPFYVQQTGELVKPKNGFTVFATGNTKGDGGDSRFIGTSVLNDAFLERFVTIIEQKLPTLAIEKKIMDRYIELENIKIDTQLYENFTRWIDTVRSTYAHGNSDIYISSRRIQYILKMYKMTGNFTKSMTVVLARYPDSEADAFLKVWKAIAG